MLNQPVDADEGNNRYQRQFARSLVASLGLDDAVLICRDNGWDGILSVLLTEPVTSRS